MNNKRKSSHPFLVETNGKFIVMSAKIPNITLREPRAKTINIFSMRTQSDRAAVWHRNAAFKLLDFPNRYKQQYSHNSALVCLQYVYDDDIWSGAKTWKFGRSGRGAHIFCVCVHEFVATTGARTNSIDSRRETRPRVCRLFHLFCTIVYEYYDLCSDFETWSSFSYYYFHVGLKESNNRPRTEREVRRRRKNGDKKQQDRTSSTFKTEWSTDYTFFFTVPHCWMKNMWHAIKRLQHSMSIHSTRLPQTLIRSVIQLIHKHISLTMTNSHTTKLNQRSHNLITQKNIRDIRMK